VRNLDNVESILSSSSPKNVWMSAVSCLAVSAPTLKSRQLRLLDVCLLEQSHDDSKVASAAQRSPLSQDEVIVPFHR
jgi:hypothetical protein